MGYCEPLPEMVKGVMHRACDALSAPSDFTKTCVDEAPKCGRLPSDGHLEMDEITFCLYSHYTFCMFDMISKALVMYFCMRFG